MELQEARKQLMKLQEQRGVVLHHVPLGEIVQRHVLASNAFLFRQFAQHGRFSRLPRAGQENGGVGFAELQDAVFHVSADVIHWASPLSLKCCFDTYNYNHSTRSSQPKLRLIFILL